MLALIYLGLAICVGDRLCGRFFRYVSIPHRWATGTLVGLVLSAGFTYLAGRHFASASNPLLWGDCLFVVAASIFLINFPPKRDQSFVQPRLPGSEAWTWIILALYTALACWMTFATLDFKAGVLNIGITQWSDYGPNTAIVQSFAYGHNFPAEYPHFAGEPIRYHFLFYFLAGNLEFLGLNLAWSVNLLSILTLVCMLALVIALGQVLFKSRAVGCLASAAFFCHGTLNLVPFLRKQTSFKGALQAIYTLRDYLTSGYPYRGEDWGIWTQVVFVNQRHLAGSIGIFLVVLIFLLDRYQEKKRQKELERTQAADRRPPLLPSTDGTAIATDLPVTQESAAGEIEAEPPLEEPYPAANYWSAGETKAPDTVADDEQVHAEPDSAMVSARESEIPQSPEELPQTVDDKAAHETTTFRTRAYDEYMHSKSDATPETEMQESEALEFVNESSREHHPAPVSETLTPQPAVSEPVPELVSEPLSEPAPKASRGMLGDLVHDNLVSGRGFIFCGLLLGALPYWNAPVFTAAFAVLAFFFVLFPCRRYMVGLAITTALIGLPQVLALRSGNARAGASLIHWGYTLGNVPVMQVVKYLGFTFGIKWVLILIGLLFGSWLHWRLFIAIFSLFLLTFCFQFSEEALANHKFLNIWLVVANLFVAYGLWRLWRLVKGWWSIGPRLLAILLAAPILLGGVIDFFPIHNGTFIQTGLVNDRLIKWVQAETKPDAIFLTDKFVNHPILLAGRKIFFGYTYFTWSAGYDLPKREAAYRQMFESKNAHQVFTLLKANGIDYVAFDFTVRSTFKNNNEQQVYVPNFKKVFEASDYWQITIYKVPENADFIPAASGSLPGGATAAPGVSVFETGTGKEPGQLNFPRGLAVDSAGNIFVADSNNDRLQKYSTAGNFLNVIGKRGQGQGEFVEPGGIAIDPNGNIYVADVSNNRVQKLKPDGSFLAEWKGPEGGIQPRDIAIGPDNLIYVVDQGHSRVVKFDPNGKVLLVWGIPGRGDGELAGPTSVAVDGKNNRVYVADPTNKRIQIFDTNGKFVATWPVERWTSSGWYFQDLALDVAAGRLYASSPTDEVLIFDLTGKQIGSLKPNPPDKLEGASGLVLVKGKLYVLNTYAGRLSQIDVGTK
jgi:DNA-binding beta-propeller fold protein YncE